MTDSTSIKKCTYPNCVNSGIHNIKTFNNIIDIIRHSSSRSDVINLISNTKINGTNIKIYRESANKLFDCYTMYNDSYSYVKHTTINNKYTHPNPNTKLKIHYYF